MKPLTDVFISGRISWFSVSVHDGSEAEFDPVDHMVLVTFVQFDEIAAPAPDAHDQVAVPLGMHLGVEQLFAADGIELQLVAAQGDVGLDEHAQFADALLVVEDRLVELEGQRPAVDHILQTRFGEGFDDRYGPALVDEQARRIVGGDHLPGTAAVGRGTEACGMENIVHGRTGAGAVDAAPLVAAPFERTCERSEQVAGDGVGIVVVLPHLGSLPPQQAL